MRNRKFSSPSVVSCFLSLLVLCTVPSMLTGCGGSVSSGGGGSHTSVGPVTVTPATTTLDGGNAVTLSATVTNDQNSAGVTWSVSGAGALASETTGSAQYTAPTATASSQTATITATSNADTSKSASSTITIPAAPAVTSLTTAQQTVMVGTAYSATLAGTGGISPYTWALATGSASLPPCVSLTTAGVLSAPSTSTASCAGTFSGIKFAMTDSGTPNALTAISAAQTITVISPTITVTKPATIADAYPGTSYSTAAFTAAGGTGSSYTWSLSSTPSLPVGWSISSGGVISNTSPANTGTSDLTYNVTVTAADGSGNKGTATFTLTIEAPITIAPTTLPGGTVSVKYSQQLTATGGSGTYSTWAVTTGASTLNATPFNITLSNAGLLSGTPISAAANQTATFTVKVTDSNGHSAVANYSIKVENSVTITTASLPAVDVGQSYNQTLQASGGTGTGYSWTATVSNLSTYGLSLSTAGVITGTVGSCTAGCTATFTANVKDSGNNTTTKVLTIQIYPALSLPAPDPASLPSNAYTGYAYGPGTILATGGSGSYSWSVTGLSDNLAVTGGTTGSTLTIGGTPATPTSGNPAVVVDFNVTLTDTVTGATITQNDYNVTVNYQTAPLLPPATSTVPGPATEGQSYTASIAATGGVGPTYTWTLNGATTLPTTGSVALGAGALASEFTISNSGGGSSVSIAGTPTSTVGSGSFTFTLSAKDNTTNLVSSTVTYTITVNAIQITIYNVPQGMVGMPYSFQNVSISGGTTPYTVTLSNLPAGLTQPTGAWGLEGTPTSTGSTTVTITVVDSTTPTAQTQTATFVVPVVARTVAANNAELKGQYACELPQYYESGVTGGTGSTLYRGGQVFAFAANGSGTVTGGEIDNNSPSSSGYQNATTNGALGGTYVVGADNRGYLSLTVGTGGLTFAIAGGDLNGSSVFTDLALTEMDDAGSARTYIHGSGHCYLQNTTGLSGLAASGGYVWAQTGEGGDGTLFNGAGYIDLGSGTLSGVSDSVSSGVYQADLTMTGNTLTAADAYGRVTFNFGPSGQTINPYVAYLVNDSSGHAFVMGANPHNAATNALFMMGEMRAQNATNVAASYPLSGTMVLYTTGLDNTATRYKSLISQLTGSTGTASIIGSSGFLYNDAGTLGLYTTSGAISYTEDPTTGRTTISDSGNTAGDVFYVYDTGSAAVLLGDVGNSGGSTPQNQLGWIEPQIVPASGIWGTSDLAASYSLRTESNGDYNTNFASGALTLDSGGNFTSMTEDSGGPDWADWDEFMCGSLCAGGSGTFVPDAVFDAAGGFGIFDANITLNSQTDTLNYCVAISVDKATDSSTKGRVACIDATSTSPQLTFFQQ